MAGFQSAVSKTIFWGTEKKLEPLLIIEKKLLDFCFVCLSYNLHGVLI